MNYLVLMSFGKVGVRDRVATRNVFAEFKSYAKVLRSFSSKHLLMKIRGSFLKTHAKSENLFCNL